MADVISESKYAKRRALRRSQMGGNFQSLSDNEPYCNGVNPAPRPLDADYIPKHTPKIGIRAWESNAPMKHEGKDFLRKFFGPYQSKPTPKRKKDIIVKYNHYEMNYAGWNA